MFLLKVKLVELQKQNIDIIEAKEKDVQELRQAVKMFWVRGHLTLL